MLAKTRWKLFIVGLSLLASCKSSRFEVINQPDSPSPVSEEQKALPESETPKATEPAESTAGRFEVEISDVIVPPGQNVQFTAVCEGHPEKEVTWQFGDGESATGSQANHSYDKPGNYSVVAVCNLGDGRSFSKTEDVYVCNPNGPNQSQSGSGSGCPTEVSKDGAKGK